MQIVFAPNNNPESNCDPVNSNHVGGQGNVDLGSQASGNQEAGDYTSQVSWELQAEYQVNHHCPTPIVTKYGADLDGYHLTAADYMIFSVCRDHLLRNDDTHLDGGVTEDAVWQCR